MQTTTTSTATKPNFRRLSAGYYRSHDGRFEIVRVERPDGDFWYWLDKSKHCGGDDYFFTKREAVDGLVDYISGRLDAVFV
jgi:hypothetical protein